MAPRIGWVGVGHIHTPGFSGEVLNRKFECAGVWDHDDARAKKNAEKLGGPVRKLEELAHDDGVTGYVICSETNRHLDLARMLVGAGKPIYLEKPLAVNAHDSKLISELLEDHRIAFQTGYFMRGQANVRALKQLVDSGHFGQITRVRASNCHNGALGGWFDGEWRWMADRKQAGVGAFGDLGTHSLDLMMWMFGEVEEVTGKLGKGTSRYPGCEEFGEAILQFKSGAVGTLAAGWDDVSDPIKMVVAGTKGYAVLGNDLKVAGADGNLKPVDGGTSAPAGFNAFLDHLEGKPADLLTPSEATDRDVVMDAIYRGAEGHKWVKL